jgi:hypothetical protein
MPESDVGRAFQPDGKGPSATASGWKAAGMPDPVVNRALVPDGKGPSPTASGWKARPTWIASLRAALSAQSKSLSAVEVHLNGSFLVGPGIDHSQLEGRRALADDFIQSLGM